MTHVAVAGALAAKPGNGGEAWVRLSYLLGLRRLGFDVTFVEQLVEPTRASVDWFLDVSRIHEIDATLVDGTGTVVAGQPVREADVLLNISGNLRSPRLLKMFPRRAYVDLDPCFTQVWHATGSIALDRHHAYFTVGENVGRPGCDIPTNGIRWRPTRPPVVLEEWAAAAAPHFDRFTTVSTWRPGHGGVRIGNREFGLRVHAFRRVLDLPRSTGLPFEAALAIDRAETDDLERLRRGGWHLVPPDRVAATPGAFATYVRGSGAEFSVAQEAYTATRCGWISDRTARYLASGRPALVADTGQRSIPTGEGLLTFGTPAEARRQARSLVRNYEAHSAAARAIAVEYLDSSRLLTSLLEDVA